MALAQEMAAATVLVVRSGRKSLALLPPTRADKGTVIRERAAPLRSTCHLGDDLGDLAAFRALDQLAARGSAPHESRCAVMRRPRNCCRLRT